MVLALNSAQMNPKQLKALGVFLGVLLVIVITLQFISTYNSGSPNYYFIVMGFGMLLLLYYTISTKSGRWRR